MLLVAKVYSFPSMENLPFAMRFGFYLKPSDGKVFRDGDHWVMFYFGAGAGGAHVMAAFSYDLINWKASTNGL